MIWFLLGMHAVALACTGAAGRRSMRSALLVAAVAPAVTGIWALSRLGSASQGSVYEISWVEGLDLSLRFRSGAIALLMTAIVSGIGALVFVHATGYFDRHADGAIRFPVSLLAFSTSMLGLVLADSVWTLFIFWELTSVTSFLLVGHKNTDPSVLTAARRALIITAGGGLALLAGLLVLTQAAETSTLSELPPISGASGTVAALLILTAVATKSAQVPFHVWLPGAMVAPTPVSAYLHSATMVKAGILLMALTGSAFVEVDAWKVIGFSLGAASMVWGGIGALRHRDAKLILAWGTISQLGLLVTLLAIGSGKAVFAATSILVAHALFKAALFLVVGEIDIRTGTRNIDELGGLFRSMPVAAASAILAGLSMAGVPPLLGFTAKEAAIEAALGRAGTEQILATAAVVGGSVLTVAYTARLLWSMLGPGPATEVKPRRLAMTLPAAALAVAGLAGYVGLGWVNTAIVPVATELNTASGVYELIRWPGVTTAFTVSMAVLAAGSVLAVGLARLPVSVTPAPVGAEAADRLLDGTLRFARVVTARVQHGSLPVYLVTMGATVALAASPFLFDLSFSHLYRWDHPLQMLLAVAISASALTGAFVGSRLGAALTLGAVGIGVAALFVVHGAPDLALTQVLVETIVVVGFVVGLGHLARSFPPATNTWRGVRIAISVCCGAAVTVALAASSARPTGRAPLSVLAAEAVDEGGGNNIVNVILTDMRALDTLGEVVVLATVGLGIVALANAGKSEPST